MDLQMLNNSPTQNFLANRHEQLSAVDSKTIPFSEPTEYCVAGVCSIVVALIMSTQLAREVFNVHYVKALYNISLSMFQYLSYVLLFI